MSETFINGRIILHCGDCIEVLATLLADSIDSVVCDPPYHLQSIHKRFAKVGRDDKTWTSSGPHQRTAAGFMNKKWDGGDVSSRPETWAAAFRVMKPGAFLVAFGGTRTYHRMACAIEDAGFEVRDTIAWLYGSGFPKSHDVSKGIDRQAGAVRKVIGRSNRDIGPSQIQNKPFARGISLETQGLLTAPATAEAAQWEGWGTALKPAFEPLILARKPLGPGMTVAGNVLAYGTGGINIAACRVQSDASHDSRVPNINTQGRWPANLVHDGSDEVLKGFPENTGAQGIVRGNEASNPTSNVYGAYRRQPSKVPRDEPGSAARFFYIAKADVDDRLGSKHPTVKPLDLMQWLVRLVTPPGGTVLDCFAGTGTTGEAAFREGFNAVLIERESEYQADIRRRMSLMLSGPDERRREVIKASGKVQDAGPLFANLPPE